MRVLFLILLSFSLHGQMFFGDNFTEDEGGGGGDIDPTSYTDLELWLDGDDPYDTGTKPVEGADATGWTDKSGNGWDYTIALDAPKYANNVIGSVGGWKFDLESGSDGFREDLMPNLLSDFTLIIIYEVEDNRSLQTIFTNGRSWGSNGISTSNSYFIGWAGDDTRAYWRNTSWTNYSNVYDMSGETFPVLVAHTFTYDASANEIESFERNVLNQTKATVGTTGDQTAYYHAIGFNPFNTTGHSFEGHILEVIFYSQTLSATDRNELYDDYLQPKYGF